MSDDSINKYNVQSTLCQEDSMCPTVTRCIAITEAGSLELPCGLVALLGHLCRSQQLQELSLQIVTNH
jgi:hypothetical protein